jgi:hypothetical protein
VLAAVGLLGLHNAPRIILSIFFSDALSITRKLACAAVAVGLFGKVSWAELIGE